MRRTEVKQLLSQYTPLEQCFQKIYQQTGQSPTSQDLIHVLKQYGVFPHNLVEELQGTDCTRKITSAPSNLHFADSEWFLESEDISVRKHIRYSPAIRHTHSFIEISYVAEGSCRQVFYFQSGQTETRTLPAGALCIIPPRMEHDISVFDDSIVINILIRASAMKHTLTDLVAGNHALFDFFLYTLYENTTPNYLLFHTGNDETIQGLMFDMIGESCDEKQYHQKAQLLMLGLFFTYLQRDYSDWMQFSKCTSAGISFIPQILNYIQQNYADISLESIAQHFSISTSYLGKIFRENTKTTVFGVIQQVRIQKACELLTTTRLSVQSIAEAVGYENVTYFIRMFKKYIKTTPLQYRKKMQK